MLKGVKHNTQIKKLNAELKQLYIENNVDPTHKYCCKCEQKHEVECFVVAKKHVFGRSSRCKVCDAAYMKEYSINNKEKIKIGQAKKFQNNKHKYKENFKKYAEAYRPIRNSKSRQKYQTDQNHKIKHNLRTSFTKFMNGTKSKKSDAYGISWEDCITHLGPIPLDMLNPSIDHIIPCEAFDFTNPEHPKLCYHPTNLRWLEYTENCSKRHKIFPELIRNTNNEWICEKIGLNLDTYLDGEYLRIITNKYIYGQR